MGSDGSFVIVWESNGPDHMGIFAQRFDSDGHREGSELSIRTSGSSDSDNPAVAMGSDGSFVVTWTDKGGNSDYGIYARIYDAQGNPTGSEFPVNRFPIKEMGACSDVIMGEDGALVVVWQNYVPEDGLSWEIFAQRYSADGRPIGPVGLQ